MQYLLFSIYSRQTTISLALKLCQIVATVVACEQLCEFYFFPHQKVTMKMELSTRKEWNLQSAGHRWTKHDKQGKNVSSIMQFASCLYRKFLIDDFRNFFDDNLYTYIPNDRIRQNVSHPDPHLCK